MLLVLVLYALFASTFILGREAALACPPILFIAIRMMLAGCLLLSYVYFSKKEPLKIKRNELFWFAGIVLFHIYGSYICEFVGLQYLTGAKASLLYNLSPFITALFSYFFFKEILSSKKWLGLLIGFLAFIPVMITQPAAAEQATSTGLLAPYAEWILVLSVTMSCIGWIFMKRLISTHNHSYVFVNGIGMLIGGFLAFPTSYAFEAWPSFLDLMGNVPFIRSLLLLILIGNIICYNLYGKLLHTYSATALSFFGASTPIFAALFGWLWLKETVTPWFYVTALLVAIGLYIFYKEELSDGLTSEEKRSLATRKEEDAAR